MGVRGGLDLALLGLAGLLLFASLPGAGVNGRTLSVARLLVVLAAFGTVAYGWLWAGGVLEPGPTAQDRVDALMSLVSGRPLVAEIVLAWLALWALLLTRRPGLAALFAMAAVVVGGWGGHPTSYTAVISAPANALHLAGVADWTGGLLLLVTEAGSSNFPASARRVSDFALVAGGVVAVTGLVQSWIFVDSLRQLTHSTYGLLVLAKVGGLVILVAFGAYHRFRLVPGLDFDPSGRRLSGSVGGELTVAAGVIVVGAILSHIPPNP
jgi:putative copper export protein